MFKKAFAAAALFAVIGLGAAAPALADPSDDYAPAAIETGDGPRDVGAKIDDASGPRATVTEDNPNGAGVAPESANGPRKVGKPIDNGSGPRPVQGK